jgi:peptidoglycan hydrolase-like protein with peptidoglycan-binding domain
MSEVSSEFYGAVLHAISAPVTPTTLGLLRAWQHCEGGNATFNPFNTTMTDHGASDYNDVGVKNYPSEAIGIHATAATLGLHYYEGIRVALREQNAHLFGDAVDNSPWGTRGVASYLAEHPVPAPGQVSSGAGDDEAHRLPVLAHGAGMPPKPPNVHVKTLQGLLHSHGLHVAVDGRLGPATVTAVEDFQESAHLAQDGVVGPHTWAALLRLARHNQS